jgi:GNAT superfamily N-acetyltransferase
VGPRAIVADEVPFVAQLWFDGWQDAHADVLPAELAAHRTLESFIARLRDACEDVFVVGPHNVPIGFYLLRHDELNQFYVSRDARGTGVAAALLGDAEARLSQRGITGTWLTCAIGNERAARFDEKHGWRRDGVITSRLPIPAGHFDLEVWRYSKALS